MKLKTKAIRVLKVTWLGAWYRAMGLAKKLRISVHEAAMTIKYHVEEYVEYKDVRIGWRGKIKLWRRIR